MPSFEDYKTRPPKPTDVVVETEIGKVNLVYDRNAMTPAVTSLQTGMRERLSRILLGWDITNSDEPMQPPSLADEALWRNVVRDGRSLAHAAWERQQAQLTALTDEMKARQRVDPEPLTPDAPITTEHIRNAYAAAWMEILLQFDNAFIEVIDGGPLDSFLGVSWRKQLLRTSSSTATNTPTVTSLPGSTAPSVSA